MSNQPHILHVSADFPDPVVPHKTQVIRSLLELTDDGFEHEVLSLNRTFDDPANFAASAITNFGAPRLKSQEMPFDRGVTLTYRAPPFGLLHGAMLDQLGEAIAARLRQTRVPDLLVAHKLTVEGLAVERAAELLGRPFAVTIQGNTDTRIMNMRPDLTTRLRKVFQGASAVMSFAPWSLEQVERRLGRRAGPKAVIPCPTDLDHVLPPRPGRQCLLSMFHLHGARNKNLKCMAAALRSLQRSGRTVELAVAGGGDEADTAVARALAGGATGLHFIGPLERAAVAHCMNNAAGFILPSRRESFGLVFIEALFAGCPIIYPSGRAVDGYFDDCPFALRVSHKNTGEIAEAMMQLIDRQDQHKDALANWQHSVAAERFTRPAIATAFSRHLHDGLGKASAGGLDNG